MPCHFNGIADVTLRGLKVNGEEKHLTRAYTQDICLSTSTPQNDIVCFSFQIFREFATVTAAFRLASYLDELHAFVHRYRVCSLLVDYAKRWTCRLHNLRSNTDKYIIASRRRSLYDGHEPSPGLKLDGVSFPSGARPTLGQPN